MPTYNYGADVREAAANAAEKTLRKYRGVKEGLPAVLANDSFSTEQTKPLKWYPRKRGTLGAGPQDFDESKPVTSEGKPYYSEKETVENKKAKGGTIKKMARGGGIESRGKTKGRFV